MARSWLCVVPLVLAVAGCTDDDGSGDDGATNPDEVCMAADPFELTAHDDSGCGPAATDYQPLSNAAGDGWPECVTDDGAYHVIDSTPSSIARVEAYEEAMEHLAARAPTPEDFTAARAAIAREEGLESRLVRREDLHYPPIPESEWDPGVDPDKQCTVDGNISRFPERCAGPGRILPIINDAFAAGQLGDGSPVVAKAQIQAALLWFLHLSVYKEANTCLLKAKDCDSAWAYYTGGFDRAGGIGLAGELRGLSELAHQRVWDGFSAYRCWRELYPIETYPSIDDVDAEGQALQANADAQLDDALWYGWSRIVRDRMEQLGNVCDEDAEAAWAFLRIAGPVLAEEASRVDSGAGTSLGSFFANAEIPATEDLQGIADTIDSVFGCP